MSKKMIAFLMAIVMVVSMLPLAALAEETKPETVTPAEVSEDIDQAQKSEAEAIGILTAADELVAMANQQLAQGNLDAAADTVEKANDETAKQAETAEDAAEAAEDAADEADKQNEAAGEAADAAEDALSDAQNAGTKQQAQQAADNAEKQSEAAASAAADAAVQSSAAAQKAEEAKTAYETAKKAAEDADAEAKQLLSDGLISMEEADERAKAAADLADAKYAELLAAQQAADEAAAAAKTEADAAKEALQEAADKLEEVTKENAENVLEKGAAALITGGALEASKIAVDVAQAVVKNYEGDLAELKVQVAELDAVIDEAQKAIDEAQEKLDALDAEDAEYPKAVAALEAAQAAKEEAQNIKENAQTIIDARNEAYKEDGYANDMTDLQSKVASGTATLEEKQQLTKLVLENIGTYDETAALGEIHWVEGNDSVFYIENEDGSESYYEVQTKTREEDGSQYLQYYQATREYKTVETKNFPSAEDVYKGGKNAGTETTVYKAYDSDMNEYPIEVTCKDTVLLPGTKWEYHSYSYYYTVDGNLMTLGTLTGKFMVNGKEFTVKDSTQVYYASATTPIGTNSNSITDQWEKAADAENNLKKAEDKLAVAQQNHDDAKVIYDNAKATLNEIIDANSATIAATQPKVDELNAQIEELDTKLNGSTGDQLLRSLIEGDLKAGADAAGKILALTIKSKLPGGLTEDEKKELDELNSTVKTSEQMLEVIAGLADGNVDGEDVKNIIGLLADNTISAKTRLAIANAVKDTLQKSYDKAAEELKEAIAKAEEEITAQAGIAADAAVTAAERELALVAANGKAALAKEAADRAADLKERADQAAKDAHDAYLTYKYLVDAYATDKDAVNAALLAYETAQQKADEAAKAAEEAAAEAKRAEAAAEEARRIADAFPVPEEVPVEDASDKNASDKNASDKNTSDKNTSDENTPVKTMTLAQYAYSLLGKIRAEFGDAANMTNPKFVELVFARYGYTIDLSSNRDVDVTKNGTRIDNSLVQPGDIICIYAADGTIAVFGIYYGDGNYVFYNELTQQVETAQCPTAANSWFAVRVIA